MKVRIKSGNETGAVKDLPQIEAENALATGFAELVDEKDQAELDKKVSGAPDVSAKKAEKLVEESPSAKATAKGKTGKATPTGRAGRRK
jgi:hypothetical protein